MRELIIELKLKFPYFDTHLINEIVDNAEVKDIPDKTQILKTGQYVKKLPVVLNGAVKVYSNYEEKEFLLYYVKSAESCIMSLSACLNETKSVISAITVSDSKIMLLPSLKVEKWISISPAFNKLFYKLYDERYSDMINTLNSLLFENLEDRLLRYLYETRRMKANSELSLKHREIAEDLGTAREVISRLLKKLEKDKKLIQIKGGIIKIL